MINLDKIKQFTLQLGLFPHHQKHCVVHGNSVLITTHYSVFPSITVKRVIKNNSFRYNNHLYNIPDTDGLYTFNDLHIKTID